MTSAQPEASETGRFLPDDEAELWSARQTATAAEARETLFSNHAAFARQIAARYFRERTRGDLDLQELWQLAYAGLLEAIDRFDPARGVPFRGYAARRIAGSVLDGIAHASEVREQVAYRTRARSERLRSLAETDMDDLSTSEALRALAEIATGLAIGFMLDSGMAATEETADRRPSAYDSLAWKEAVQRLLSAVETLPSREQLIVRRHYLEGVGMDVIAGLLGVSKGRVSQLHKAAISRLRTLLIDGSDFMLQR
jgi:RNA polymerase sigma factor for flagellar operon FliA